MNIASRPIRLGFLSAVLFFAFVLLSPRAVADDQAATEILESAVEAMLFDMKDDPAGFEAAVEAFIMESGNAALAVKALVKIIAGGGSQQSRDIILGNASLKEAAGRGIGSAIARIGLVDPAMASASQAVIEESRDAVLQAAVEAAYAEKTASIWRAMTGGKTVGTHERTPETPVSPN